jgi:hypothetical protein
VIIDCESCAARGSACADCVVTVLLDLPGHRQPAPGAAGSASELTDDERTALGVLADSGLVPPLRLVPRRAAG